MRTLALVTTENETINLSVPLTSKGSVLFTPEKLAELVENHQTPKYKEGDITLEVPVTDFVKIFGAVQVYEVDMSFSPTLVNMESTPGLVE